MIWQWLGVSVHRKCNGVVSPAMARDEAGVLSTMARYNEGVLPAMARVESGVSLIQSCPLPSRVRRLEADPGPACVLTMRAADKWGAARFTSIFLALGFSTSRAESRPTHLRLTLAVSPLVD